jgi:hypothetical protein
VIEGPPELDGCAISIIKGRLLTVLAPKYIIVCPLAYFVVEAI